MEERSTEDLSRQMKLTALYHTIDNADKLGLDQDHLRELYNQVGEALGHKPDPKLLGLFRVGDKGSKGIEGLGDLVFSQEQRDKPIITGGQEGKPFTPDEMASPNMPSPTRQLGPAPEMITSRQGAVPVADLTARRQLAYKKAADEAATNENIRQGQELAKGQILPYYKDDGTLGYRTFDPIKKEMTEVPISGGRAVSTVDKQLGVEGTANKDFNMHMNLLLNDPQWKDRPEPERKAEASHRVSEKVATDLAKTVARTKELNASTSLERAREHYLSVPTPEQNRNFTQRQQGVEIRVAQQAIQQGVFDRTSSTNLVRDLKDFQSSNAAALKSIEDGNTFNKSQDPAIRAKAEAKWKVGYLILAQAKIKAELMRSTYPDMVRVAGTDPSDSNQFPWVETNYDFTSPTANNQRGKKRSFNPSPVTARPTVQQYREALKGKVLKGKVLTPKQIEAKVKKYYPGQ